MRNKLKRYIPTDHARQVQDIYYIGKLMKSANPPRRILDLGCGTGNSIDLFRKYGSEFSWKGLDISLSPEVSARIRTDCEFYTYDGVNIPFSDESFDLVYCHQVMEHVRYPERLLKEVFRVLVPGGSFVGSTSYLEPYHSYSLWNYTPYGWVILINDSGMQVVELRPGIDSVALINRQLSGEPKKYSHWFGNSPLNQEIDDWGSTNNKSAAEVNYRKLHFCGQFAFYCRKIYPGSSATTTELGLHPNVQEEITNSFSFRLGNMLVRAVCKPGSNTILLPYRLVRLCVTEFRKRKMMSAKKVKYTRVGLADVLLSTSTAMIRQKYIERFGDEKGRLGWYHETDWGRIEYISSLLPEAKSVLDIGIGNGAFMNLLISLDRFQRIVGIDIRRHSKFMMLFESQLYQIMYASVTNLPFADKSIDVVTCMEVLEHLDKQSFLAALPELRRVGRFLVVTVPYNESEPLPSYHKLRFIDGDLLTYFPRGKFILLERQRATDWMVIVEHT